MANIILVLFPNISVFHDRKQSIKRRSLPSLRYNITLSLYTVQRCGRECSTTWLGSSVEETMILSTIERNQNITL